MGKKSRGEPVTKTYRLDPDLLGRVDAYAERLAEETGLPNVSQNAAVAVLLRKALDAEGVPEKP